MSEYLTPKETADRLRVTTRTVRNLIDRGEIVGAVKVGRQWRIPAASVAAVLVVPEITQTGVPA
jgi:excisionase family DNA binding protein